jgi:hypothetical protein
MHKTAHAKSQVKSSPSSILAGSKTNEIDSKLSRTVLGTITCLTALIGIWGIICLFSGLLMSGGIVDLGTEWVSAVLGLER